jgi:hypothetical protein
MIFLYVHDPSLASIFTQPSSFERSWSDAKSVEVLGIKGSDPIGEAPNQKVSVQGFKGISDVVVVAVSVP